MDTGALVSAAQPCHHHGMRNTTVSLIQHVNGLPRSVWLDGRVTRLDVLRDHLSLIGGWSARLNIAPPQGVTPLDELNVADGFLAFVTHAAAAQAPRARFAAFIGPVAGPGHPLRPATDDEELDTSLLEIGSWI
jgi:hypothetical protein